MLRALVFAAVVLVVAGVRAAPVLDINNPYKVRFGSGIFVYWSTVESGKHSLLQTFTPTVSGDLTAVDILGGGDQTLLGLWSLADGHLDQQLAYSIYTPIPSNWLNEPDDQFPPFTQVPVSPFKVTAGTQYALTLTTLGVGRFAAVGSTNHSGLGSTYDGGAAGWVEPLANMTPTFDVYDMTHLDDGPWPFDLHFGVWIDPDPIMPVAGDVNSDGKVDLTDFGIVKDNFGKGVGTPQVPEPSAWALLAIGTTCLALRRRH